VFEALDLGPDPAQGVTRLLSEEQLDDYEVFFDNHRRLKELVAELEALSLSIVDADPRWEELNRALLCGGASLNLWVRPKSAPRDPGHRQTWRRVPISLGAMEEGEHPDDMT
jgi:hypothetical protein